MAHKITDECIGCENCISVCPFDAISKKDAVCVIDPDVCVDCGACAAQCPVSAIEEA
ncbi:MAG TPA: 4Fe-4S binding protein [Candidatus Fimimonas merdipullorum]|uniref:Ferredoxin n=1 Tax=Candidatus Fimimonas merdipullorum TaxID=2840822 RepID=A0A9D1MXY2_9BACT|nr:4Fe-4S binding protein [Candidatus Fimimonas merdipullorum]